jgi:hypothetical protein
MVSKQSIFKETTYIGGAQHVYIMSKFPTLEKRLLCYSKPIKMQVNFCMLQ